MSTTPLSDRITQLVADDDASDLRALRATFLEETVGLAIKGLPAAGHGETHSYACDNRIEPDIVTGPQRCFYLKVCADPPVFSGAWQYPINMTLPGRTVLEIAAKTPSLAGIMIFSATSADSVAIERSEIDDLLARARAPLSPAR